jgi:barstar (barnase inhibitor)
MATSQPSLGTHLQSSKPPWTALLLLKPGQHPESTIKIPRGFVLKVMRGGKCRRTPDLFAEMAAALTFPDYFEPNWDALEECLADLEWLPGKGYVLLFTNADQILVDDDEEFVTLLEVLSDAGEAWASGQVRDDAKRPTPFHTLFAVPEREKSKLAHRGLAQVAASSAPPSGSKRRFSRKR